MSEVDPVRIPKPELMSTSDRRDSEGGEMTLVRGLYTPRVSRAIMDVAHEVVGVDRRYSDLELVVKRAGEKYGDQLIPDEGVPEGQVYVRIYGIHGENINHFWSRLHKKLEEKEKTQGPKLQDARQKHADHYVGKLLNPGTPPEELRLDFGQIAVAVRRSLNEEVTPLTYIGQIDMQFRKLAGGFVNYYLPRLLDGSATKSDVRAIEEAIQSVENGEAEYPVNSLSLKSKLRDLKAT